MKHAYLILAHNEPKILDQLLRLLENVHNDIYVHIDRKADDLFDYAVSKYKNRNDIRFVGKRFNVNWGGGSQVKIELYMLDYAQSHGDYSYFHLLSGVDLPIKPIDSIYRFFEGSKKNFVGFHRVKDYAQRVEYHHLFVEHIKDKNVLRRKLCEYIRRIVILLEKSIGFKRKYPFEVMKGANWFSITADFANYIVKRKDEILKTFRYIPMCDEVFMQTIIWNSSFRETLYNIEDEYTGCMRKIDWVRGNPYIWQDSDLKELLDSDKMFARKFSLEGSEYLLTEISRHVMRDNATH